MTGWPSAPVIHEIDTWPWLTDIGRRLGRPVTLAGLPADVWDEIAPPGADAVWLMGVWERSPAGLEIARTDESLQRGFWSALHDLTPEDVAGSPYCVHRYVVDERLGGPEALAEARSELAKRGLRLVLDYVPNHVAPDHPAVLEHPEWFVQGDHAEPGYWFEAGGRFIAHGRDPYFAPWPDVVQLNAFEPTLRTATVNALTDIAAQCDGMRVDMAMLVTNEVFERTWGKNVGPAPAEDFWPYVIPRVKAEHPGLVLIAEVYWDTEWALQNQGFDFCYDKRLYDRLAGENAGAIRKHLEADLEYQSKLLRFTENHDEPRAAATFAPGRDRTAAVAVATLPGATLWHDGQFEGRRQHLPVFLARRPDEPADEDLLAFYQRLTTAAAGIKRGSWSLADCRGWPDNATHDDVLAWAWSEDDAPHHVTVLNFAPHASQARVVLPWDGLRGHRWRLEDPIDGRVYVRGGDELAGDGLYVDLPPWGTHLLSVTRASKVTP